ncbi:hypothetical protein NDU88_004897 [Pleurodeles waltl]|uniref:Uncharacterized protein n=1 Tax=Pleurodeles waltl TaxID=8319 RepID=A0AAV7LJP7_PLEWA|nr:hypothetical protein NDU88_004897 [Pleurodeles waltl]
MGFQASRQELFQTRGQIAPRVYLCGLTRKAFGIMVFKGSAVTDKQQAKEGHSASLRPGPHLSAEAELASCSCCVTARGFATRWRKRRVKAVMALCGDVFGLEATWLHMGSE